MDSSIRVKRKTLQAVLEECQRALEMLTQTEAPAEDDDSVDDVAVGPSGEDRSRDESSSNELGDREVDDLYDLIKSRVECQDFLEKIESAQVSAPQEIAEDGSSWDMVSEDDLWGEESTNPDEDYVLVKQEDIVDGIACFMATYLLSLKQTKELSPDQLQKGARTLFRDVFAGIDPDLALGRTFSLKKRKGKLQKAWDGSKVIYNVASWSATVFGIYQNPMILRAASNAFWASCHVISKLV